MTLKIVFEAFKMVAFTLFFIPVPHALISAIAFIKLELVFISHLQTWFCDITTSLKYRFSSRKSVELRYQGLATHYANPVIQYS